MEAPCWFPDELAHAGVEHLDPEYVLGYDRKAGTDPTEDVALFRDLGLNENHTLVDLGTGTGTLALAAAPHCRRVVAVDVSDAMLTFLKEKTERLGIKNIECVQGGFLTYEHQGEPADFVYSRNALHHLPDFFKALAIERIASMLRAGGVLRLHDLVFSFDVQEAERIIEAWLASAAEQTEKGWTPPEMEKDVREEHITFSWLLEPILERASRSRMRATMLRDATRPTPASGLARAARTKGSTLAHPYSPECVEGAFSEVRVSRWSPRM